MLRVAASDITLRSTASSQLRYVVIKFDHISNRLGVCLLELDCSLISTENMLFLVKQSEKRLVVA